MTRNDLEQIYYLSRELRLLERELERLRGRSLIASPLPSTSHASGVSDKVGDKAARIVDLERRIEQRKKLVAEVYDFIDNIKDAQMRIIVKSHCVYQDSWNETLDKVGGEATSDGIKKRYLRFLKKTFQNCPECPECP